MVRTKRRKNSFGFSRCERITSAVTKAPALMNGLRGLPCSYSSCTSELNADPEGSFPMRVHRSLPKMLRAMASENTFAMLCIENFTSEAPMLYVLPSSMCRHSPNWSGSTFASAGI